MIFFFVPFTEPILYKFIPEGSLFSGNKPADRTSNNMQSKRPFIDTKGSLLMKEILGPKDFNKTTKLPVEKLYGLAAEDRGKYVQMLKDKKPIRVTNS